MFQKRRTRKETATILIDYVSVEEITITLVSIFHHSSLRYVRYFTKLYIDEHMYELFET